MDTRSWDARDEHQSLTKRARDLLVALVDKGPIRCTLSLTREQRELTMQGLAFQAHNSLSTTDKGREARERVA